MFEVLDTKYRSLSSTTIEEYILDIRNSHGTDAYGTIAFLRDRIDESICDIQSEYKSDLSEEEKPALILRTQIVASYLLLLGKTTGYEFQQKFLLLLEALSDMRKR